MGQAGRAHVEAGFSIQREAERIDAVYGALIGSKLDGTRPVNAKPH